MAIMVFLADGAITLEKQIPKYLLLILMPPHLDFVTCHFYFVYI